jgi:formate hydrogenlyase subunit 6/NADH:ubiquinone oxidoreductase subunit I
VRLIKIDRSRCIYCGACVGVCPKLALILKETFIEYDEKKCINCGTCAKACPMKAIEFRK